MSENNQANTPARQDGPPRVKPSTIICTFLFALMFTVAYFLLPYALVQLPFYGTNVTQNLGIQKLTHEQLIEQAMYVVVGKVDKTVGVQSGSLSTGNKDLLLVYTVYDFAVEQVLRGGELPETIQTYTLGGSLIGQDNMGRPTRTNYSYADAATLGNGRVILFLDSEYNLLNEKYGVYKLQKDDLFYDYASDVYSIDDIKNEINSYGK